jgi:hypothetical protein
MQQRLNDEDVERYLKTFQPRGVAPLRIPEQTRSAWASALAIAAAVILAGAIALWYGARLTTGPSSIRANVDFYAGKSQPVARSNVPGLTQLALDDNRAFEARLANDSRIMFPSMQGERSALRVLAKP